MLTRREFFKICAAAGTSLLFMKMSGCGTKKDSDSKNPYEYNIDKFKKTDESLVLYQEISSIPIETSEIQGFSISPDDIIFVADSRKVYIHDLKGNILKTFTLESTPSCITACGNNELYAGMNDHIEIYDYSGQRKSVWNTLSEESHITAIAVKDSYVILADSGLKQLWLFNRQGNLIKFFGKKDGTYKTPGFVIPSPFFDVRFDSAGNIWAVNSGRLRLEKYSPDGEFKSGFGNPGMEISGFSGCCNPAYFILLPDNKFITSEKGLVRVKAYNADGSFMGVVAGPEKFDKRTKSVIPACDARGIVYIADAINKKIRIFRLK